MIINVDTGKLDKECELNRCYACCGCVNYYDESDTVCKRGCIHYFKKVMTQEEKDLLLKDLSARLPYEVKVITSVGGQIRNDKETLNFAQLSLFEASHEDIKPYLRPMSSMTKEEYEEYRNIDNRSYSCPKDYAHIPASDRIDWLNAHHFDYRGLIPMGLANDATGLNIY